VTSFNSKERTTLPHINGELFDALETPPKPPPQRNTAPPNDNAFYPLFNFLKGEAVLSVISNADAARGEKPSLKGRASIIDRQSL